VAAARHLSLRRREAVTGLALVTPFALLLATFLLVPIVRAVWLSFTPTESGAAATGPSIANYQFLADDPLFHKSLLVTGIFALASVVGVVSLSVAYAVMADGVGNTRAILRTLLFIPALTPLAVAPILWRFLLHPTGLINDGLGIFGIAPLNWLTDRFAALVGMTIANVWYLASLFMIVVLSGLRTIPADVYDAARVDGAGRIARFRWITLPLLRPAIAIVVIVCATLTIKSPVLPLLLTSGGPDGATRIISLYVYETGFRFFHFEAASAASVVLMLILVGCSLGVLRVLRAQN